jgi:hypothetical protein
MISVGWTWEPVQLNPYEPASSKYSFGVSKASDGLVRVRK